MHRFFSIVWSSVLSVSLLATSAKAAKDVGYETTGLHRTIVKGEEWLNVPSPLNSDDLKGRIILLGFWSYGCISCVNLISDLKSLKAEFGGELSVIGVHSGKFGQEKDTANIRDAIIRNNIEYPVVNDPGLKVWKGFAVKDWPTLVLINPLGNIDHVYSGEGHLPELRQSIKKLREKYATMMVKASLPVRLEKDKIQGSVLSYPGKVTYDSERNQLYISDSGNNRIVATSLSGEVVFIVGKGDGALRDGSFEDAAFRGPQGLLYGKDSIYVADTGNHSIRRIDLKSKKVETLLGNGQMGVIKETEGKDQKKAKLASPYDLAFYPEYEDIVIAMAGSHQLWKYNLNKNELSVFAGSGMKGMEDGKYPFNSLAQTSGLSRYGDRLYFLDPETSSLRVLEQESVKTLIGKGLFDYGFKGGPKGEALMQHPLGLFADESGVYIADTYNSAIRIYDPKTERLSTITGLNQGYLDGSLREAKFREPSGLTRAGNKLFIADTDNQQLRSLDLETGDVRTIHLSFMSSDKARRPAENLPVLKKSPDLKVASGKDIRVFLAVGKDFMLNDKAPNWIAIYAKSGERYEFVNDYKGREILKKQVKLPILEDVKNYRVQGTIYYCGEWKESICYVQSFDQMLIAKKDGVDRIDIPIGRGP